jgi:hypothetical protein
MWVASRSEEMSKGRTALKKCRDSTSLAQIPVSGLTHFSLRHEDKESSSPEFPSTMVDQFAYDEQESLDQCAQTYCSEIDD